MRSTSVLYLILIALTATASPVLAAWPNAPATNRAVCTAANNQSVPTIVSDGAGGAIITWYDLRGGSFNDIYAQHLLASGAVDPAWPTDGRALCTALGNQYTPTLVADGAGGAIVTWYDYRSGTADIYAQHVLATGALDPAWPLDGKALCTAANSQLSPTIVADGSGGAIVTWQDLRGGGTYDIYAQHVLASGAVDPAWPVDGRALCTAANQQSVPTIVADGAGGAIVTWYDLRGGATYDIYAQHVLASGAVDPAWPVDGRALCTAVNSQLYPTIISDGIGGAIVSWTDYRGGVASDIYAQHVLALGAVDPTWPVDGRAICVATNYQYSPMIIADAGGGAIITWYDLRTGSNYDIYAQHLLASGAVDPAWPADGRALCTAAGDQNSPTIDADGAGGAFVTWYDSRSGSSSTADIYAQHVFASGAVDPAWPADGRALCTATNGQFTPTIVADGTGGAIVTWYDNRSGTYDIYAQRVARYGYLGTPEVEIAGAKDVPNDQGGRVKLSWGASYLEGDPYNVVTSYRVYRSVPSALAASMRRGGASVTRIDDDTRSFMRPGELFTTSAAGVTYYWEYLSTVSADFVQNYSCLAPTAQDSVAPGPPLTAFMVQARTAGSQHWESQPVTGYSVDNLRPAAPAPFTGQYTAGQATLHWNRNTEADLAGYRLYRGTNASFTPGAANLVAALADTGYADASGVPSYYKLTAIDAHGNESPVATLLPVGTLGVDGGALPRELSFAPPAPNPVAVNATLRYALPRAGTVRLAIHDPAGRLVRELASGPREAGTQSESWDLRDASGHAVGAGLYFARLECEGRTIVRRIAVTR